MTITNALASVAVRDLDTSAKWYETFLGSGNRPMPEVVEWQLERGGGLQVYQGTDRAGHCSCTLIVTDIDETAWQLRESGVAPDAEPASNPRVDTIMIKDPDGNSIAFAQPKDGALAH
jgi:predicted enzyme related to lactoylglutathione lyase